MVASPSGGAEGDSSGIVKGLAGCSCACLLWRSSKGCSDHPPHGSSSQPMQYSCGVGGGWEPTSVLWSRVLMGCSAGRQAGGQRSTQMHRQQANLIPSGGWHDYCSTRHCSGAPTSTTPTSTTHASQGTHCPQNRHLSNTQAQGHPPPQGRRRWVGAGYRGSPASSRGGMQQYVRSPAHGASHAGALQPTPVCGPRRPHGAVYTAYLSAVLASVPEDGVASRVVLDVGGHVVHLSVFVGARAGGA